MERPSQRFDRQLFTLKLSQLSSEMEVTHSERRALLEHRESGGSGSYLWDIVESRLTLLREELAEVDRLACEVWAIQGEAVTAEFFRDVLAPEAIAYIEKRQSDTSAKVRNVATRPGAVEAEDSHAALYHLANEINRLKTEVSTRYEIEARTLELKRAAKPMPKLPEPIEPVSTASTVTRAPRPPSVVGGLGTGGYSAPKPSRVPDDPPMYFPSDLWPKTECDSS